MVKKILIGLAILLVVIQAIRPARNISTANSPNDIAAHYPVAPEVYTILQKACFDCHSNDTRYPWYTNIQPVGWWLQHHVNEGKEELNFSEFAAYDKKKKLRKLNKISKSVTEGWMPLKSYLWIHKDAALTKEEVAAITGWTAALAKQISEKE